MKLDIMRWLILIGSLLFALVGCSGAARPVPELLPLSPEQPTFIFFYTDN